MCCWEKYYDKYDYCGMPDGGSCNHRNASWIVMNPFFNIFNCKKIKSSMEWIMNKGNLQFFYNYKEFEHIRKKPEWINYNKDINFFYEPYNGFFNFLFANNNPLYLKTINHSDGISSILLNQNDKEIVYHSWYARTYGKNIEQTNRINNLYSEAKLYGTTYGI